MNFTLDADVERSLQSEAERKGQSVDDALNDVLRRAFCLYPPKRARSPFVIHARPMGLRLEAEVGRLADMADELEVEAFMTLSRRLGETLCDHA